MLEKPLERLLFACRWLLAPVYLGLSLALIALGIKFFQEALHVLSQVTRLAEADLALVGSLIVMVMFSGYKTSCHASTTMPARMPRPGSRRSTPGR